MSAPGAEGVAPLAAGGAGVGRSLGGWIERVTERLNPIVVKEVRQGLRTKVFWIFFALMLFVCLVVSLIAFAALRDSPDAVLGPYFFFAYFVCLGAVQFFVIPYAAYRSLAREREDETWVLLTLTGLGPRKVLRGKLGSFLIQATLYASAAAPFMLFSYYLNGIDMPTILAVLLLGAGYQVFLTAMAVSAATLAEHRILRALVHFGVLGALLFATSIGLTMAFAIVDEGSGMVADDDFWLVAALAFWAMLSFGALLFEAAASRLSLPTEPYARGPRLVVLAQTLITAAIMSGLWLNERRDHDVAVAAQVIFCAYFALVGLFVVSDVNGMAKRHRVTARFFSLLRPGALRGYRLVFALLAACSVFFIGLGTLSHGGPERELFGMIAAGAYVALYLSAPIVLTRSFANKGLQLPLVTRLVSLGLLFLGSGLPPLLGAMALAEPSDPAFNLFNPVLGLAAFFDGKHQDGFGLVVLCAVALGSTLAADRVLAHRDRESP